MTVKFERCWREGMKPYQYHFIGFLEWFDKLTELERKVTLYKIFHERKVMKPEETIESFEIEENRGVSKSSHTKNPTTCADVRRSGSACGICGSMNVVSQGVKWCEVCDLEVDYIGEYSGYWWSKDYEPPICDCDDVINERGWKSSPRHHYSIEKCIDCDAVNNSAFCPNCYSKGFSMSGTWKHWDGRIRCGRCGFTIDNPLFCNIGSKVSKAQGKLGTRKAKKKYMSRRQRKRYEAKHKPHPNKVR